MMLKRTSLRGIILMVVFTAFLSGCGPAAAPTEGGIEAQKPAVPVEVAQVGPGHIASTLAYAGDLNSTQNLTLVSIVSGAIEEVLVEVGDEVRAGDPILRVEDTAYRAQLKQAESGLAMAQLNKIRMEKGPRAEQIAMAEAGLMVAQANLNKLQNGPRPEQVAMAETAVEGAQAQLDSILTVTEDERTLAASQLAQAEAGLRLAQAEYDKIKWAGQVGATPQALQLQQATIAYETAKAAYERQVNPDDSDLAALRAGIRQAELGSELAANPFTDDDFTLVEAGVQQAQAQLSLAKNPFTAEDMAQAEAGVRQAEAAVALAQYQVDNSILRAPFDGVVAEIYVTTGNVASPQSPAIKLISNELEIVIQVPEAQIADVFEDQPAALKVSAYPGQDFPALVDTISPAADSTSHTFPVTITPVDDDGELRAGMFAEITLLLEEKTNVILVPRSAVTLIGSQEVVYVVSEDEQTVTQRVVTSGLSDVEQVEIVEGLSVGETVVTAGLSNLSDGSRVEIVARTE